MRYVLECSLTSHSYVASSSATTAGELPNECLDLIDRLECKFEPVKVSVLVTDYASVNVAAKTK